MLPGISTLLLLRFQGLTISMGDEDTVCVTGAAKIGSVELTELSFMNQN